MRPPLAVLLVLAVSIAAAPVASADASVACETDPPARCFATTGTDVATPVGYRGNYSINVDARDNGSPQITIDEQGMHVFASLRCDTSGDTPQCFPVWASLSEIPTAGFVFTGADGKGASAGVILFAQGSAVGCFIHAPTPGGGQPSAACFP